MVTEPIAKETAPSASTKECSETQGKALVLIHSANPTLSSLPAKIAAVTPVNVMPTCTVERKSAGVSSRRRAAAAPASPWLCRRARRARLAEAKAISAITNSVPSPRQAPRRMNGLILGMMKEPSAVGSPEL